MADDDLSSRVTVLEQRVDRLETAIADFRAETAASFDAVHQALIRMQTQREKDFEHLNTRISALHEDVIARIATLGELWTHGRPGRRKKR